MAQGKKAHAYTLGSSPCVEVEIDGAVYEMNPGQLGIHTQAVRIQNAADALAGAGGGDDVLALVQALEDEVRALASLAFGPGSVDALLGERGRFDVVRALGLVRAVLSEASSASAIEGVRAKIAELAGSVATLDE